ncbi:MAG: NAD-dependent epimerase/dehydratase family protein [Deltaproteobacteria bacterium]|jgi:nucleoside-diphosphate-sugar epimerase|nr:NAD-dependent epimerase/dehydratase family protein [Deltaproteobacteria bacterium]
MLHLVTGGCGYLGNLVARRLLETGEKVRILDIWRDESLPPDVEFIEADVRNTNGVAQAMKNIDVVHHNAAMVPITKSGDVFRQVNVDGSRIVAEEAVKAGVSYFVYMSSSAVFGNAISPIFPDSAFSPVESYGQSKMEGELAVKKVCDLANLPLIIVRPRTILGLGRLGIFQILFEWISEGRNVYVIGDGNNRFQFVHALDLMDAYMLALKQEKPGVYNVGAAEFGTMGEAIENVIRHAGTKSRLKHLPIGLSKVALKVLDKLSLSPLGPYHYHTYQRPVFFDVNHLLEIGWKPQYSNNRMFEGSYDWFLEHKDTLNKKDTNVGSPHRRAIKQGMLKILKWIS